MLVRQGKTEPKARHTYVVFASAHRPSAAVAVCGCLRLQLQCCGSHLQTN